MLARAEPGGMPTQPLDLRTLIESEADAWLRAALALGLRRQVRRQRVRHLGPAGQQRQPRQHHAPVDGRLKSPGSFRRELFSGSRVFGAVRPSYGELVLQNSDGALDEWADYGLSGGKVVVRMGPADGAYPSDYTTVYIAYAHSIIADFAEIRIRLRDRLQALDRPLVTQSFAGTGGIEGGGDLVGKLKQWVSSDPYLIPITLVDHTIQLYHVQSTASGGLGAYFKIYEGGIEIPADAGSYANVADLLANQPTLGHCKWYFGAEGVYVRLRGVPQFDLRAIAFGFDPTTGGAFTVASLAGQAGISGGVAPIAIGALLVDDSRSYLDVCQDAALSQIAHFGMTRLDVLQGGTVTAPSVSPIAEFHVHNTCNLSRASALDMDAPVWSVTVHSGKRWPGNVASGAPADIAGQVQRTPWYATFAREVPAIRTANPGAVSTVVEVQARAFQSVLSQTDYLDKYFALFGVRRAFYSFDVPLTAQNLAIELHDTVSLRMPRFGLDAGKAFRVVTQQIDCSARKITYGVWG